MSELAVRNVASSVGGASFGLSVQPGLTTNDKASPMPRISGVVIPDSKQVRFSLPTLYGIGRSAAKKLITAAKIDGTKKAGELSSAEIDRLQQLIEKEYTIEGELRAELSSNIKRLITIGSRRGKRHEAKLPVRGQHTRKNARTRKGRKMTVATGRRAPPAKT